ncbi:SMAD/FHA domain-containing protein, partial [Halteromyces radiatus]|uniref:SMAD/FHA domain-containing protein n=1 Tax=Halteromyces radiatus TaxID=101107 RepID=UPI002220DFC2
RSPRHHSSSRYHDERSRSRSPEGRRRRRRRDDRPRRSPSPGERRQRQRGRHQDGSGRKYTWGGRSPSIEKEQDVPEPEGPNYGLSGKLAAETNTVNGVELKYNEPGEAAKPKQHWRFYVFKGSEQIDLLHVHRQSAFLIGRDRAVVDIPVDHPSCSKQHAVLQYRLVSDQGQQIVKPFIIDLESTNGTFINGDKIPSSRYVELKLKDVVTFGQSTREYVLLHAD